MDSFDFLKNGVVGVIVITLTFLESALSTGPARPGPTTGQVTWRLATAPCYPDRFLTPPHAVDFLLPDVAGHSVVKLLMIPKQAKRDRQGKNNPNADAEQYQRQAGMLVFKRRISRRVKARPRVARRLAAVVRVARASD